jgi:hypothetical protein
MTDPLTYHAHSKQFWLDLIMKHSPKEHLPDLRKLNLDKLKQKCVELKIDYQSAIKTNKLLRGRAKREAKKESKCPADVESDDESMVSLGSLQLNKTFDDYAQSAPYGDAQETTNDNVEPPAEPEPVEVKADHQPEPEVKPVEEQSITLPDARTVINITIASGASCSLLFNYTK